MKRLLALAGVTAVLSISALAAACDSDEPDATQIPAAAQPTAMMEKTPEPTAMIDKADVMMEKTPEATAMMDKTDDAMMAKLPDQRFAAHFVDSVPAHAAALDTAPEKIAINFNFTLGGKSEITLLKDGKAVTTGAPVFAANNLMMAVSVPADSGDGLYEVDYNACWPDGSCHKGLFAFTVRKHDAMMDKDDAAMMGKTPEATAMMDKGDDAMMGKMPEQMFAAHFVDSIPAHGTTFAASPARIVINFDFTLGGKSAIRVLKDEKPLDLAAATISGPNKLTLEVPLFDGAGDGLYVVDYDACWPDGSCHQGKFAFVVDSKLALSYTDMTGKAAVAIAIKDIAFGPKTVVVSKGTKVTWTNGDSVAHFVNTDPHPTHNHTPALNSLALTQGQDYSFMFDRAGEFPYHCSAHTGMTARVLVKG